MNKKYGVLMTALFTVGSTVYADNEPISEILILDELIIGVRVKLIWYNNAYQKLKRWFMVRLARV